MNGVKSQQKGDTFSSFLKASSPGVESNDEGRASSERQIRRPRRCADRRKSAHPRVWRRIATTKTPVRRHQADDREAAIAAITGWA